MDLWRLYKTKSLSPPTSFKTFNPSGKSPLLLQLDCPERTLSEYQFALVMHSHTFTNQTLELNEEQL